MTKEQEITLLYQLIEKHFGSGVLMQFEDLTETDSNQLLNRIETMDMYPTYESAKIKHPECDIYEHNCTPMGKLFTPGLMHSVMDGSYNNKCNPADHCMTVEKFLADGHKFVEGDIIYDGINAKNITNVIIDAMNIKTSVDSKIYILRAAALETKEPKRTKERYEKLNFECAWHAIKAFEDGEKLYTKRSSEDFVLIDNAPDVLRYLYDLHERIETHIEWWEDASDFINQTDDDNCSSIMEGKLHVNATLTQDQWCDFARILLEQGE